MGKKNHHNCILRGLWFNLCGLCVKFLDSLPELDSKPRVSKNYRRERGARPG